jgi:plastocyanin
VALDLKTGALRWHYQVVHHDMWDADLGTPLVLYDDKRPDGKQGTRTTKAVAVMRTDGVLFQLDRATGKPLVPVQERVVKQNKRLFTARTQPYPVGVEPVGRQCVDPAMIPNGFTAGCFWDPVDVEQVNVMLPFATARSAPMAYDASANRFYIAGGVSAVWHRRGEDPGYYALARVPGIQSYGLIAAIDAGSGRIAWQKRLPHLVYDGSGVTATAGGLLFHGDPDGTLQAYNAKDGALLWQFQTGAPAEGPVAVYAVKGEQMVALAATGAVWAFRLGGTLEPAAPPPPRPTVTAFAGRVVTTDRIVLSAETGDTLAGLGIPGAAHKRIDEFATAPVRAKVKAGAAITIVNEGKESHELAAADGSWSTGPIAPGKSASLRLDRPGSHTYVCKDHPFTIGEIVVE